MIRNGKELLTAFFSSQLRGAEKCYSTTEWETLTIVAAVQHLLPLLYRRRFAVVTDHKPLITHMTSTTLNKKLKGRALHLAEHDFSDLVTNFSIYK